MVRSSEYRISTDFEYDCHQSHSPFPESQDQHSEKNHISNTTRQRITLFRLFGSNGQIDGDECEEKKKERHSNLNE